MRTKLRCKQGQVGIGQLVPFAIIFIIAGLVLGAGALVMDKFANRVQTTSDTTITNGTVGAAGEFDTGVAWDIPEAGNYTGRFISMSTTVVVVNGTGTGTEYIVAVGNYTAYSNGSIILTSLYSSNLSDATITYTYTLNDNPIEHQSSTNASQGMLEVASFLPTIGIIIAIVIIIGLVVGSLSGGVRR